MAPQSCNFMYILQKD